MGDLDFARDEATEPIPAARPVDPAYELHLHFSETFIKRVGLRYCVRLLGWRGLLSPLLCVGLLVFAGRFVGPASWQSIAAASLIGVWLLVVIAGFVIVPLRGLRALRAMREPRSTMRLHQGGFDMASDLGSSTVSWRAITRVWRFREAWLLFFDKGVYITLPTAALTPDSSAYLLSKVVEHGGKID